MGRDLQRRIGSATSATVLVALLAGAGTLHVVTPRPFDSLIPGWLGSPRPWVIASGVAELLCAAALAAPPTRRRGAIATAALFVAVFPGNVVMALHSHAGAFDVAHNPVVAWGRLPLQVPLVLWALAVAAESRRRDAGSGPPSSSSRS